MLRMQTIAIRCFGLSEKPCWYRTVPSIDDDNCSRVRPQRSRRQRLLKCRPTFSGKHLSIFSAFWESAETVRETPTCCWTTMECCRVEACRTTFSDSNSHSSSSRMTRASVRLEPRTQLRPPPSLLSRTTTQSVRLLYPPIRSWSVSPKSILSSAVPR